MIKYTKMPHCILNYFIYSHYIYGIIQCDEMPFLKQTSTQKKLLTIDHGIQLTHKLKPVKMFHSSNINIRSIISQL